jgi:mRNA-degrading endonuclease RelE of RelBE toxin-antitoxin system
MEIRTTKRFERAFRKLPQHIQDLFEDKLYKFEDDWQHPSLRAKRVQGTDRIWEASINMSIRFTFEWVEEDGKQICLLRYTGDHDHCLRPPY